MANNVFYFFYAPTWDYPPEGPIKLGNVITSIKKPEWPLYTAPLPTDSEVFSSGKSHVEFSKEKLRAGKFSILTKFLSILGVGVDVGANWDTSNEIVYTFDRVETTQFIPKEEYVQKCIEAAPVRRYLDKSRYRKPVYIITGLKTVTGARAKSHKSRAFGGNLGVEVDGTIWSGGTVPIGGGPEVEGKTGMKEGTTWEGSSDFVFAFRVRKISVEKETGNVKENDDYNQGAFLGNETKKEDVPKLSISAEEDPEAEDEGCEKEELMEGDALISCAVPKAEEEEEEME
ncbi:hypothetical protein K432DRAFT_338800 [Lepidopterella palustris CBS 459.81]|uniref:Uncharacterized protein n=1 Tax=Lepidopterella palustris CBS 459.81 TaxID=1314670 RepID=A0A8E2J9R9_9PEZI|nr:hypothetical protein K432DRAFT_338800 [Lepidopterella palustris CBS 459.81]